MVVKGVGRDFDSVSLGDLTVLVLVMVVVELLQSGSF